MIEECIKFIGGTYLGAVVSSFEPFLITVSLAYKDQLIHIEGIMEKDYVFYIGILTEEPWCIHGTFSQVILQIPRILNDITS